MLGFPSYLNKLLTYAEPAISNSAAQLPTDSGSGSPALFSELMALLKKRNGFFAFEKALHVFPTHVPLNGREQYGYSLSEWNSPELWKNAFSEEMQSVLCFAEDIFGCQWGLQGDSICKFDPETNEVVPYARSLEEWAKTILKDARVETGWPLAHEWIQKKGSLPANYRLNPKTLFVLGGSFELDNLFASEAAEGMRFRGDIARQIRHLPDGTKIKITPR